MIPMLVQEINDCLNDNHLIAALTMALTLPDVCGKAEYPNERSSSKRYVDWFDTNLGETENPEFIFEDNLPSLTGEVVYQTRCSFLHQGTPYVDIDRISAERNKANNFKLVLEDKNDFDIYCDHSSVFSSNCSNFHQNRSHIISVRRLCLIISSVALGYYKNNKEKFSFINVSFEDRRTTQ